MTCASCSGHIKQTVLALSGVQSADINLLGQSGFFTFDRTQLGLRDIAAAIQDIGFTASLPTLASPADALARTQETRRWRNAFLSSLAFSLPVSLISMVFPLIWPHLVGFRLLPGLKLGDAAQFVLTAPVLFSVGWPLHIAAYRSLRKRAPTMDLLVSLGTNIAFFFSSLALLHGIFFPDSRPEIFFEASSTLITFITLGRWMYHFPAT